MDDDDRPRPRGDAASRLAGEPLDGYSVEELNERIQLLESEVVRIVALRDKAKAHRVAADALFGGGSANTSGSGSPATQKPDTRSGTAPPSPDTR
jgi:uncharacterized small protein (DUF1192 family)